LSHADFRDGARALQSRIPNKQTISGKIPSLFAFLARVSRMMRALIGRKILQISPEKMEMKNIPGAFGSSKQRESNQSAEVLRQMFRPPCAGGGLGQPSIQWDAGQTG